MKTVEIPRAYAMWLTQTYGGDVFSIALQILRDIKNDNNPMAWDILLSVWDEEGEGLTTQTFLSAANMVIKFCKEAYNENTQRNPTGKI